MKDTQPELYMDTLTLHTRAPVRTHSDFIRTFYKGLDELVHGGLLVKRAGTWSFGHVIVAKEFDDVDSMNRPRKALRFGSWLCLALALKVSREDVRQMLLDAVKKHPIY